MNKLREITLILESESEGQFYTYFFKLIKAIKKLDQEFKTSTDVIETTKNE